MPTESWKKKVDSLLAAAAIFIPAAAQANPDVNSTESPVSYTAYADGYSNMLVPGIMPGSYIVSGERNVGGKISWSGKPEANFDLDVNSDPRYAECLKLAKALKEKYRLNELGSTASRVEIERREAAVVHQMVEKIHEQYGNYNPAINAGGNSSTDPSLHHDMDRDKSNIPHLLEFKSGELVCRHYAPLASVLLTEAGMDNVLVSGNMQHFYAKDGRLVALNFLKIMRGDTLVVSEHDSVVSRRTCNVVETTMDNAECAYMRNLNGVSFPEFVRGKTIVTTEGYSFGTYGTGDDGGRNHGFFTDRQSAMSMLGAIEAYDAQLANGAYEKVRPAMENLSAAAEKGDAAALREYCDAFPFGKRLLYNALGLAAFGQNLEAAQVLIDHGALEALDIPELRQGKDQLIFNIGSKPDPAFMRMMAGRLGYSPAEVLDKAKAAGVYDTYKDVFSTPEASLPWTVRVASGQTVPQR